MHLPIVTTYLSRHLGRPLRRVEANPKHGPTPDLETDDGAPHFAFEVKELVPGEFLSTREQVQRDSGLDSGVLRRRWSVIITEDTVSERLGSMPRFAPDPPEEEIERYAKVGFAVVRRRDRGAQWLEEHTLARRPQIRIKGLTRDIEPHLATLEALEITSTRGAWSTGTVDWALRDQALLSIARRTGDALCMAHDLFDGQTPGVDLHFGWGYTRTGRADVVAERVERWLHSPQARNLVESLTRSAADFRHAVLWLDEDAERWSADEQGVQFVPSRPFSLPTGIDVLWLFVGSVVLRYDGSWTAALVDPERAA